MEVDTIVSLSTPPGIGAVALVRLSGPGSTMVLRQLLARGASAPLVRVPTLCELVDLTTGETLDCALVTYFRGPASYTGEDLIEISTHGGFLIPELVVEASVQAGARPAEPGEFTKRAYLHGKLDLVQAEAIADLIGARSRAFHRVALGQLERGLSTRVSELRGRMVHIEALLAHHVDFPEEDDAPVPIERVVGESMELVAAMDALLATAPEGELLREGALAVFAGRPNGGKSSLYNALIGEERAIVTDEPGTTRDALESVVQIGGFPFRLVDTAGLREPSGTIEKLGIEVAHRYIDRADIVLFCLAHGDELSADEASFLTGSVRCPVVVVHTKADLRTPPPGGMVAKGHIEGEYAARQVDVSAVDGTGLDELRECMAHLVYSEVVSAGVDAPVVTRARQARALRMAREEVEAFRVGLVEGLPAEVAATHLRTAETSLEELLGIVSVDDVLDVVFREFCVGK
jgi:tRNA modification GTPase